TWPQNGDTFNYPLINNGPGTTAYMIKRIEPDPSWSGAKLLGAMDAGSAKSLPYQSNSFGEEWVGTWGTATKNAAGLALSATPKTSGADAFLNGSGWWTNYYFSAVIDWQNGESVSLIARNHDDETYLACAFTPTEAVVELHQNGGAVELARASQTFAG